MLRVIPIEEATLTEEIHLMGTEDQALIAAEDPVFEDKFLNF